VYERLVAIFDSPELYGRLFPLIFKKIPLEKDEGHRIIAASLQALLEDRLLSQDTGVGMASLIIR
jgi:hypothetical protein